MQQRLLFVAAAAAIAGSASSQSNTVPGLDGKLYDISSPTVWGRRGAAFPNGEIGFSASNTMCNPGSVSIPWFAAMAPDHPKFGFMVVRVTDDRMVQISDRSMCKHAFLSLNNNSGPCIPCSNTSSGSQMFTGCSDVYSAGNNGSRSWLGPADEIDPWLGIWNPIGSYFDRGDPDVGPPRNTDGIKETISAPDQVKNRVTIQEQDLLVANSTFYYQIHLLHQGESVNNRGDNIQSRLVTFTPNGGAWNASNVTGSSAVTGSVLTRWSGANVNMAANGNDDGRIEVAVKVSGPNNGLWHYEYAVHNVDNSRGAATLRIPTCSLARVLNVGFRDIDSNALNQWTGAKVGSEFVYTAPANNPMNWNMLFNFWFDSDAAPVAGNVTFDEARVGPGALSFTVPSQVPGFVPNVYLGDGCGTPSLTLTANGIPTIPNPGFAVEAQAAPFSALLFFLGAETNVPLGGGCTQYVNASGLVSLGFVLSDVSGIAGMSLPIPPGMSPGAAVLQAVQITPGSGAFLGDFNLSNGLKIRAGLTGCP